MQAGVSGDFIAATEHLFVKRFIFRNKNRCLAPGVVPHLSVNQIRASAGVAFHTLDGKTNSRFIRLKTFSAQNRTPDFWLKRHGVVLAAVIANYLKTIRRVCAARRFFRAAFQTSLRRRHISLVKNPLFFFGKKKSFTALHASHFNIGHRFFLLSKISEFVPTV